MLSNQLRLFKILVEAWSDWRDEASMDITRGNLILPFLEEYEYKKYRAKIDGYFRDAYVTNPQRGNSLKDAFWACVGNNGYWLGAMKSDCDELEIVVDDINIQILRETNRLNDLNFQLKTSWRQYLQGLFNRRSLPINGFLVYVQNLYCPSPEYRTLMKKLTLLSKAHEMKQLDLSTNILEIWATFTKEYEMIFGLFEKISIFIGKQFDEKVDSLQQAYQLYTKGDRTPGDVNLLGALQNIQHLRNAIKHEHVDTDEPDRIKIWDEIRGKKNWEREYDRAALPNLYEIIYQMHLLLQTFKIAALVVKTSWNSIIRENLKGLADSGYHPY